MNKNKKLAAVLALFLSLGIMASVALPSFANSAALAKKDIINSAELKPTRTGYLPLDTAVDEIFSKLFTNNMSAYDKIKAVYDYMIYNYAGSRAAASAPDVKIDYSLGKKPAYSSKIDDSIIRYAMPIIETHAGSCLEYTSAFVVFAKALGFEAYRLYGQTALAGGGMGQHYWPVIIINDVQYVFDPQVDDHIAGGGNIRYMRFCKTVEEVGHLFSFANSKPAGEQIIEHNNFDMPTLKPAQIISIDIENEKLIANEKTELSLELDNPDDVELLYSFFFMEGSQENSEWLPKWEAIALNSEDTKVSWTPEKEGSYTLKATIKSKSTLSVIDTKTMAVLVEGGQKFTLNVSNSSVLLGSPISLRVDAAFAETEGENLLYDFAYNLNGSSRTEFLIKNSPVNQLSFTPMLAGDYLFTAFVKNETEQINTSSVGVRVHNSLIKGDVDMNGRITANDARIALRASASTIALTKEQKSVADVNGDDIVSAVDARIILRVSAKMQSF